MEKEAAMGEWRWRTKDSESCFVGWRRRRKRDNGSENDRWLPAAYSGKRVNAQVGLMLEH